MAASGGTAGAAPSAAGTIAAHRFGHISMLPLTGGDVAAPSQQLLSLPHAPFAQDFRTLDLKPTGAIASEPSPFSEYAVHHPSTQTIAQMAPLFPDPDWIKRRVEKRFAGHSAARLAAGPPRL